MSINELGDEEFVEESFKTIDLIREINERDSSILNLETEKNWALEGKEGLKEDVKLMRDDIKRLRSENDCLMDEKDKLLKNNEAVECILSDLQAVLMDRSHWTDIAFAKLGVERDFMTDDVVEGIQKFLNEMKGGDY